MSAILNRCAGKMAVSVTKERQYQLMWLKVLLVGCEIFWKLIGRGDDDVYEI